LHQAAEEIRLFHAVQDALSECDAKDLPSELIRIGQDAVRGSLGKRRTMQELVMQLFEGFSSGPTRRLDTGFQKLDGYLMGMRPGNLVILAARPGVGKSAFAMQIAENVAKAGKKVIVYSMEMKGEELTERLIANHSGVPMDHIIQHEFEKADWQKMTDAANELYKLPIIVNDEANVAPSKVRTEALEIGDAELIVVDYVGLMESDGGKRAKENRNLELGSISRDLKKIAAELEIPVLMLCQLNRDVDEMTMPELRHLRDSGELEQNANKILFLWKIDEEQQTVGVSVAKNRQGKKGIVQMLFDGEHMRFLERYEDIPMPDYKKKSWKREELD
jgi:replicative DNA helicase